MKFQTRSNHLVDFVFTIALFLVFAGSSLAVILLASNVYRSTSSHTQEQYSRRTALSYVVQKVRQSDQEGSISAGSFKGVDALVITQQYQDTSYTTYIYAYDGSLRELFIKEGAQVGLESGKEIVPASSFSIEEAGPSLFHISIVDENDDRLDQYLYGESKQKG